MDENGVMLLLMGVALLMLCFAVPLLSPIVITPAGHKTVLLEFGMAKNTLSAGLSFKIPLMQDVMVISVQKQKYEIEADAASKDLQDVQTTIAVNYRVDSNKVLDLYTNIGLNYRERIIAPAVQESIKAAMASFNAENLITNRDQVKQSVRLFLRERLTSDGIDITDVSIVNFQFSEEFDKAIEEKQAAQQLALKALNELERVKIEAEQKVVQAQAEADSIRIQTEQLKGNKEILTLRFIEAWDGELPKAMLGSDIEMLFNFQSLIEEETDLIEIEEIPVEGNEE